jgi:hypothetical protein
MNLSVQRLADGALQLFFGNRKFEPKDRSRAVFTSYFDGSGVFLHDAVRNRQP